MGNDNKDRGHPQVGLRGNHGPSGKENGNRGRLYVQQARKVARVDDKSQCYAFAGKDESEASDAMITHHILVCDGTSNVLLDLGFTFSYVAVRFVSNFEIVCDILDDPICVSTPVGESVIVTHVYHSFPILFMGFHTLFNLVILYMDYFEIFRHVLVVYSLCCS